MKKRLMVAMSTFTGRLWLLPAFAMFSLSCASTSGPDVDSVSVSAILNNPEFKQYIHPHVKGRVPVVIVSNGLFDSDLELGHFEHETVIVESEIGKPSIVFSEFEKAAGRVRFELRYDIEGIVYTGVLKANGADIERFEYEVSEI